MIAILGGTFDPIHYGHLKTARDLLESLALEQIRFIPCGIPPHRAPPVATAEQRLAMVAAAIQGESRFVLDDREIHRSGPSYMVETLISLREELGEETPLALVVGLDAFAQLESWHRWPEIIKLAHILVMTRPGYSAEEIESPAIQALLSRHQVDDIDACNDQPAGLVVFCRVTELDISSTAIRQRLKSKEEVDTLLPPAVLSIIKQQQIYV